MKRLLLIIACLPWAVTLWANPVTADQARQKAAQFLMGKRPAASRGPAKAFSSQLNMVSAGHDNSYYIFNAAGGGFAVVSGEDATEEILGYSETGRIDPDNMPCGMKILLDTYAEQIKFVRKKGITKEQSRRSKKSVSKSFHVGSRLAYYDQDKPYNNLCPKDGKNNTVTGCAATAMAQLMYYYKWPSMTTTEIPSYISKTRNLTVEAIPANTSLDWSNILNQYNSYLQLSDGSWILRELWNKPEQADAIASLMKYAGASVHMDYASTSNAYAVNIPFALKKYFGYESANCYSRFSNDEEWNERLCSELETNGPIIYYGKSSEGGHFFMLEGYKYEDGKYYYSINFGADAIGNDDFLLTVIDGLFTYVNNQCAILDVKPQSVLAPVEIPLRLSTTGLDLTGQYLYSRSETTNQFENVSVWASFRNVSPLDTYFDYGFRFVPFDNISQDTKDVVLGENLRMLSMGKNGRDGKDITDDNVYDDGLVYSFNVGNDFRNGFYKLKGFSKETGSNVWLDNDIDLYRAVAICNDKLVFRSLDTSKPSLIFQDMFQTSSNALRKNQPEEFLYTIKNSHSIDYYEGYIMAAVVWREGEVIKELPISVSDVVQVLANQSSVMSFTFTPPTAGEQDIVLYDDCWQEIGRQTVNVVSANASLDMLEVTGLTLEEGDLERQLIDGTTLRGEISLKNNDVVTKKNGVTLRLYDVEAQENKYKPLFVHIEPNATVSYGFSFANLTDGHHYIIYATYTSSGEEFYSSVQLTCTTEGLGEVEVGNDDLVAYEYWFDDDVDNRKTVGMNSNAAVIRDDIDTRSLSGGLHWFNFRLKRADGKYSPVSSSPFMNLKERKEGRIEYWFDDDYSNSGSMSIADTEEEQEVALDMSDISKFPLGLHTLNMRVATEGKSLGNIYTTRVLKTASGDFDRMEYWVDDNFSSSDGRSYVTGRASEDQSFIFNQPFNLAGVPSGPHRLYYRAVSAKGTTSSAVSMTPIIVGGGTPAKIEYWFDGDATKSATVDLPAAALQDTVNVALLMGDIQKFPLGMHQLSMRLVTGSREQSPLYTARVLKMATGKADRIEYWVDDDREHLGCVSGKAASGDDHCYIFTDPFDLSGVSPGLHCIYYRAASSDGIVSSAVSMTPVLVGGGSTAKLEYWFDDDYEGDGVQTLDGTFNEGEGVVYFDEAVNLDYLSTGVHRLYYRGVNADGVTRTAVSMNPVLVKSMFKPDASGAKILGYSISVDGKEAKTREFTSPRSELVMEHVLDARDLTTGTHRVKAKIWNSAYAGVSVEQQFSVLAPTVPTLTLVAEEHDGLVSLRFDAVPNDLRYRTIRVDANGAKAKVDGKEGSSYPGTVAYTDNPAAGTYTYYVQTAYTDYLGEQHSLKSNEVTVTVAESPAQEVVAEEFGYITGRIVCDKNTPTYGLKVHFSDGVTTNVVTTAFARTRIPVGTVLTLTVTGDDTHEYEPATVTVAAGANNVTLQGTLIEENHVSNLQNDLAVCSPLKLTVMDGRHHVKFSVKNLSHENDWQGTISLKAIDKKKADKNGLDVATMGYEEKNLYVGESFSLEIGYNATKEVDIFIKGLKLKQDTEFYLYLESTGSFLTSNLSPLTSHLTKPLAVVSSAELAENPAVVTIGRTDGEPAGWNKDYAERFAYLMLGVSSLLDGVSGPAGDLSLFYDIGLAMAKEITGKRNAKEAISDWLTWLSGKPVVEVIDNPTISNAISAIYGIYTTIGPTYAQKYWKDILGASWDYASAQLMMGNLITIGQAVTTDDPIEATLLCSSMVYSLFYSGTAAPYASMMYSYMVVGQSLVNKVLQFASIMRGRYIVTRLKANKPYSGSDEGRQNTAVDFKLVVKTKNLIGSSKIDFTKVAASRQVKSISIKVAHQKGQQQAEFSFNPVFQDDGIMLKTDGNGITNSQLLDDQNDISEFYMEINWANGRQTLIPLNEEADGIDISFKGTDPQGIDHFEDFKPLVYTVTLTTATGKDNIPDELYLGSNKKRQ